jgi:hypothetical protein
VLNNQLGPLNANTDLVTLQIGGNDVNFANTVLSCGTLASTQGCINAINSGLNLARNTLPGPVGQHVRAGAQPGAECADPHHRVRQAGRAERQLPERDEADRAQQRRPSS